MGKIRCECEHVIVDQTDNLSYKGYILPDQLIDEDLTKLVNRIDSLFNAIQSNEKEEWLAENFLPDYPKKLDLSSIISDIISVDLLAKTKDIFECENCGRILIEKKDRSFKIYKPEGENDKGILKLD